MPFFYYCQKHSTSIEDRNLKILVIASDVSYIRTDQRNAKLYINSYFKTLVSYLLQVMKDSKNIPFFSFFFRETRTR